MIETLRVGTKTLGLMICGGLAIALAVTLVTAPLTPRLAAAQSAANPNDQPNAATLPPGTGTLRGRRDPAADTSTGDVSPPSRIRSSTDVMEPSGRGRRVDPVEHLSPNDRRDGKS